MIFQIKKNLYQMISNRIIKNFKFSTIKDYSSFVDYDRNNYLPNNILYKTDRMSMFASLEARVPFLGNKTVSVAKKIPPALSSW